MIKKGWGVSGGGGLGCQGKEQGGKRDEVVQGSVVGGGGGTGTGVER